MTKSQFILPLALLTFFSTLILNLVPAQCQTVYSLYDIAKLANQQSQTIRIAEDDLLIAQLDKDRAMSVLFPRATAYANMTEYENERLSNPDTVTLGVQLTQSFTINGKELIALDITKKTIEGKEFSLESIRSQYLLKVARTYYRILSAQKYHEIAQADVERLTTYRNAVKEKLEVGSVTKTDLYRAEAELSRSMTEEVRTANSVLQIKAALQNLVVIDDNFDLVKEDIKEIEGFRADLGEILTQAFKKRPEIKEARKNLHIARETVRFKRSDYWPTVSLEGGYRETTARYHTSKTEVDDLYFTGGLVFTLFDGGLIKAQVKQALADMRKAKNAVELQEKAITLESKTAFLEYETAKSTLKNLQYELTSARENFKAVEMQFKYEMADSINVMDANTLLVSAQRRISDARYTLYFSILNILYTKAELTQFFLNR